MRSHKKLWDLAPFSNRASLVLAKNDLFIVTPSRNIKVENLILSHIDLSNFESVPNSETEGAEINFERFVWNANKL